MREMSGLPLQLSQQSLTGYRAVSMESDGKYRARVACNDAQVHGTGNLGRFETAVEAAVAVAKFCRGELPPRAREAYDAEARSTAALQGAAKRRAKQLELGLVSEEEEAKWAQIANMPRSQSPSSAYAAALRALSPDELVRYRRWCGRRNTSRTPQRSSNSMSQQLSTA